MQPAAEWLLQQTQWLYTMLYVHPRFFLDYWSIAHLWSGCVVYLLLRAIGVRRPWLLLLLGLLGYEVVEITLRYVALHVFLPETITDQVTDIIIGSLGALAAAEWLHRPRARDDVAATFTAVTIAFGWVGSYQYRYNLELLNSPGINGWAFVCWVGAILAALRWYRWAERRWPAPGVALATTWLFWVVGLMFPGEFIGYTLLGIHEVGHPTATPLLLDLVHGTPTLFSFYLAGPITSVLLFLQFRRLLARAQCACPAPNASRRAAQHQLQLGGDRRLAAGDRMHPLEGERPAQHDLGGALGEAAAHHAPLVERAHLVDHLELELHRP